MKANRNSTDVEDAFLVLSESVQRLVGRGKKGLLGLPSLRFKDRGHVKALAALFGFGEHDPPVRRQELGYSGGSVNRDGDRRCGEPDFLLGDIDVNVINLA